MSTAYANILYDRNDTDYYVNPAGTSVLSALRVAGLTSCNTIDTDASGNLACGTDEGGIGSCGDCSGWFVNEGGDTMGGNLNFNNYGIGIQGTYHSERYQGVFAMSNSYNLPANGTTSGNLYGLAWTHSNVGGESISGLGHQLLIMSNGDTRSAIGDGIWTKYNITVGGNLISVPLRILLLLAEPTLIVGQFILKLTLKLEEVSVTMEETYI
jgi:hypothetical protein